MSTEFSFEKLAVWSSSKDLALKVYQLINTFPANERYALCDQMRRAAISVPSNIAEGSGRSSYKEKIHFIEIAFGSLMELYCQLRIATELNYIKQEDFENLSNSVKQIAAQLSNLRKSFYDYANRNQVKG